MIHIDGSQGEGGGQILRSSLALSMALGKPFAITNIRANREKPGLMRQHLTAVEASAAVCNARVFGASVGSQEITFDPQAVRGGEYRFAIGTAGSTTMVLQAIVPALLFASEASDIVVEGGTHARWAPPFEFLERALVPVLNRLGATVSVKLERHGFYPAGGGRVRVNISPVSKPSPVLLDSRGEVLSRRIRVLLSKLPRVIGEKEVARVQERLGWTSDNRDIVYADDAIIPGNAISLEIGCELATEVFSAMGENGKPANAVADEVIDQVREYLAGDFPVAKHLADQLMVPFALAANAGARCAFRTCPLSRHATTNAEVIEKFLPGISHLSPDGACVRWEASK
jgi:RNA 3'-terminal phosphate cyclase (ATP)